MNSTAPKNGHEKITQEIIALYEELRREIELLGKAHSADRTVATRFPDPVSLNVIERRLLIRSIFAFIEALTFAIKVLALNSLNLSRLSAGERMLANEEIVELSASGSVTVRRAKLRTLPNIRFAFNLLAKVEGSDFRLDVSQSGWQSLQSSVKVRDRLMHPKRLDDLLVSDSEVGDALRSFIWFENQLVGVLLFTISSMRVQEKKLLECLNERARKRGISFEN